MVAQFKAKVPLKISELFSGTESFSKVARARGHETFTVDINRDFNPDYCIDILKVNHWKEGDFDIIWASPPCTCFSVASIGSSWIGNYHPRRVETALAMAYVLKTLQLIKGLKPKFWIIENPRGVLRKMGFMEDLPRTTACYCKYGDTRMKPTDIWNNIGFIGKMCKNGNPCHISAPRGSKTGTQGLKGNMERSVVPEALCLEIIKLCETSQNQDKVQEVGE